MSFLPTPALLASGGSRHPSAADWISCSSGRSLLAFGAGSNVALWDPNDPTATGITALLRGSADASVNALRFLHFHQTLVLLGGSSDGRIIAWSQNNASSAGFEEATSATADPVSSSPASVNAIAILRDSGVFACATADGCVRVWELQRVDGSLKLHLHQTIKLSPRYFALTLDLHRLDRGSLALACAGTRPSVQVFVSSTQNPPDFKLAATLTGHEAWIRSLSFALEQDAPESDVLLASASQDKYVRLWRIHKGDVLPPMSRAADDPLLGSIGKSLSNKAHRFTAGAASYSITFEALLMGHEDWIFSARWTRRAGRLQLLTASADNSLSVWESDQASGIWISSARLGEISAQKGATTATGSAGGFWTGLWAPDAMTVVCVGRTGSWRLWRSNSASSDEWTPDFGVTGHTLSVKDVAWSSDGSYLLSTSSDQTTRLFAEWKQPHGTSWHEISRPQIHGYDLNCVAALSSGQFVSGADEKLLRVFNEPKAVAEWLASVSGRSSLREDTLPDTATIPVLGLSNKAIETSQDGDAQPDQQQEVVDADSSAELIQNTRKSTPPGEDLLSKHLLWPEIEKLYGHGYEICAVASNTAGTLIATACRATSLDHAVIRLYDTKTWQEVKPALKAHTLTVTALEFSQDDSMLLSVGRDRQCVVWKQVSSGFELFATNSKAHSRMILRASWAPNLDDKKCFATAGRDKAIHLWTVADGQLHRVATCPTPTAATALTVFPCDVNNGLLFACGLEDGSLFLTYYKEQSSTFSELRYLAADLCPASAINALSWRPTVPDDHKMQLAVASDDASLRIFDVSISG